MAGNKTILTPTVIKAVLLGVLSLGMYVALYAFEVPLLDMAAKGGWWVAVPVAIAFAFSTVHGAFTGSFWEACGIKAKGK